MKKTLVAAATAAALAPAGALGTDGYFAHGYGMNAVNPATMAFAGDRLDLGIDWFRPDRSASRTGSVGGAGFFDGSADGNERENFFIPELARSACRRSSPTSASRPTACRRSR